MQKTRCQKKNSFFFLSGCAGAIVAFFLTHIACLFVPAEFFSFLYPLWRSRLSNCIGKTPHPGRMGRAGTKVGGGFLRDSGYSDEGGKLCNTRSVENFFRKKGWGRGISTEHDLSMVFMWGLEYEPQKRGSFVFKPDPPPEEDGFKGKKGEIGWISSFRNKNCPGKKSLPLPWSLDQREKNTIP